ncbi:MAG TPA: glutamine--tRNA ligase/YqeY domain fusion protein [Bacteroidales bacterium]|jgi:glutaminyl-tRNA synthetase|nr:glutamine--tRNA ligase/YqeY domain fusion protein [Bacteroidales bacterium]HOL99080.1 glutamine--tRNA ligase/YqeY domain fusion protein [Bacteroidales bacterium]HOM37221.1 glutamine--tRNA ligase/YqeY domain fusion protein [Bacteroidales bacterium]HPD24984.1 glutamine--tRNA ligase/YqeY domain fusion protein [Bacteroidales bacterium]HRS99852.1 glutamine--tRNA ligase/YqeY domain fusion protein [Bacteroidales bacterium]
MEEKRNESLNFIEEIIEEDLKTGKWSEIYTRFPPEPNGYLHIGHAKSICLNFGIKEKYKGKCNLRFDDTNPSKEDVEYVNSIMEDVRWLGFEWDRLCYASDYFDQLYEWAVMLIKEGKAYVDKQSPEEISRQRTTPTELGIESPYRYTSPEENLKLFEEMRMGLHPEGSMVLRAKIDMNSPNMHMRDPIMYRIIKKPHDRTGDKWCIYPMYDYAHGQSDYIEGITHSICTLEFEVHRPLYDWFLDQIDKTGKRPRQIEFARLNVSYTVMSKRKLLELVTNKIVSGWDDPRMPTISGLRRRGYTPESIRNFAERIGVAKRDNLIDVGLLEYFIREDLNKKANRVMAVLNPLKVVITNYPEGQTEYLEAINNPEDPSAGTRKVSFSREIYIEKDDFMENPPKKYFRLQPGGEVRLRWAYFIKCEEVIKDEKGEIVELRCTYDPLSKGGQSPDGRKVKGTIHWVNANDCIESELRLYDRLFTKENLDDLAEDENYTDYLNPESLVIVNAKLEKTLVSAKPGNTFQFERKGYFCVDKDSTTEKLVFNRTVTLKDSWAKIISNETE